jgi:hypothetical protein
MPRVFLNGVTVSNSGKTALQLSNTTVNTGLTIGGDTNLYRSAADTLKTDDTIQSLQGIFAGYGSAGAAAIGAVGPSGAAGLALGSSFDTNLYRDAADVLKTDDNFKVGAPGTAAGSVVTVNGAQDLTFKTLTSPVVNQFGTASGLGAAWPSWTPTWTTTGTQPSIGNGTIAGAAIQVGKITKFRFKMTIGSTTSLGTGNWLFSFPFTANAALTANYGFLMSGYAEDLGVTSQHIVAGRAASTTTFYIPYGTSGGLVFGQTAPWGWGSGDFFSVHGMYEAG